MFLPRGRFCLALNSPRAFVLFVLLTATAGHFATAANVTATRLDGTTVAGELRGWDESGVTIAAPAGEQQIANDQLISLRWPAEPEASKPAERAAGTAELTDGTLIPLSLLSVSGDMATIKLQRSSDPKEIAVSLSATQLAAVQFQHLDERLAKQWDEIRRLNLASDLLVVLKRDGTSLDYVEGVLGEITDDKVEFKLEGETNRVDRAKVAGVIYYRAERRATAEPRMSLQGRSGLRASAMTVRFDDALVTITTAAGAKFAWPVDDVEFADFSAGKVLYLSDIEPASQKWTPLVGLPTGVTLAAEYGQPRHNRSAFGETLTLLIRDTDAGSAEQGTLRSFAKGLALRSQTELVYRLPAGFNRFTALAGIDPATTATGNVRLAILADDRPLLETEIAGNQPPQPIDVEISGAKRLKIVVDFGQNLDTGDWLNLCDAKIVK